MATGQPVGLSPTLPTPLPLIIHIYLGKSQSAEVEPDCIPPALLSFLSSLPSLKLTDIIKTSSIKLYSS